MDNKYDLTAVLLDLRTKNAIYRASSLTTIINDVKR